MFLAPLPMVYTFCNLFVLQEYVLMLMTSTIETNFLLLSYINKVIDTISSLKLFSKFYFRRSELIAKYNICLKTFLQQDMSRRIRIPTMLHFDKCRLIQACVVSF